MAEQKDNWDKMGVVGTFLSSTLIVIFTTLVTFQTSVLSNKVDAFEQKIDENRMIGELVKDLSDTTASTLKTDFALLALERYMRNNNEKSELCMQDKEMLTGFAESIILNYKKSDLTRPLELQTKIPKDFLFRYKDTAKWNNIVAVIYPKSETTVDLSKTTVTDIAKTAPVSTVSDTTKSAEISSILKKIVYIQYAKGIGRDGAENLQKTFTANKWAAPGIEKVGGNYHNIIKYFHPEDKAYADQANKLLNDQYVIVNAASPKYQRIVPKGQIEVWAAK